MRFLLSLFSRTVAREFLEESEDACAGLSGLEVAAFAIGRNLQLGTVEYELRHVREEYSNSPA